MDDTSEKIDSRSAYKPKYCALLIEHMKQGLSFVSFGAVTNTTERTLFNWVHRHKDFKEAYEIGQTHCRLWWELVGTKAVTGGIPFFNNPLWIFNMKNRFGWRDSLEIKQKDDSEGNKKKKAKPGSKASPYIFLEEKKKSDE